MAYKYGYRPYTIVPHVWKRRTLLSICGHAEDVVHLMPGIYPYAVNAVRLSNIYIYKYI